MLNSTESYPTTRPAVNAVAKPQFPELKREEGLKDVVRRMYCAIDELEYRLNCATNRITDLENRTGYVPQCTNLPRADIALPYILEP